MKIRAIKATPVNLALEAPYYWVQGALPGFTQTIVEVMADNGLVGLGEAPGAGSAELVNRTFAPRLVGRDALDIAGCESVCLPSWRGVQAGNDYAAIRAFGAVELALWDLRGQLWQQPLHKLLGGAVRKEIPFTDYFAFRPRRGERGGETTPEAVADYCLELRERFGTTRFEGKFSTADPRPSLATIRLLRQRLGEEAEIRIDSNKAYSVAVARSLAAELEELKVSNWEDPVGSFEEMARLRRHTSIPFSTHNPDLPRALALGAPDAFVTDVSVHGGLGRTVKFVAACEAVGLDFWPIAAIRGWARRLPAPGRRHRLDPRARPVAFADAGRRRHRGRALRAPPQPGGGAGGTGPGGEALPEGLERCHRAWGEALPGGVERCHRPSWPRVPWTSSMTKSGGGLPPPAPGLKPQPRERKA